MYLHLASLTDSFKTRIAIAILKVFDFLLEPPQQEYACTHCSQKSRHNILHKQPQAFAREVALPARIGRLTISGRKVGVFPTNRDPPSIAQALSLWAKAQNQFLSTARISVLCNLCMGGARIASLPFPISHMYAASWRGFTGVTAHASERTLLHELQARFHGPHPTSVKSGTASMRWSHNELLLL